MHIEAGFVFEPEGRFVEMGRLHRDHEPLTTWLLLYLMAGRYLPFKKHVQKGRRVQVVARAATEQKTTRAVRPCGQSLCKRLCLQSLAIACGSAVYRWLMFRLFQALFRELFQELFRELPGWRSFLYQP